MSEPTNTDRADWAQEALDTFAEATGLDPEEERDSCIGDLLANLMHLCDRHDLDFDDLLDTARGHYDAEVRP